jgi:hypothetical protein
MGHLLNVFEGDTGDVGRGHQVYYTVDLGYVKGIYSALNALLFLLLLCPFQYLVEFALAGGRDIALRYDRISRSRNELTGE